MTDGLITAESPNAVATTMTAVAVSMPAIDATASRRLPCPMPREMRNSIAGPGSRIRAVAARANDARVGVDGIPQGSPPGAPGGNGIRALLGPRDAPDARGARNGDRAARGPSVVAGGPR
jgi:hypothetical protein